MLTVNNIEVIYWGSILVLKGVSLSVGEGTITALIGANGAGKTTTLKAITGLVRLERGEVTRGTIEYAGRRIEHKLPEETARAGIVMVREGRRLFDELTAEENLLVGAALHAGAGGSPAARIGLGDQFLPPRRCRPELRAR